MNEYQTTELRQGFYPHLWGFGHFSAMLSLLFGVTFDVTFCQYVYITEGASVSWMALEVSVPDSGQ